MRNDIRGDSLSQSQELAQSGQVYQDRDYVNSGVIW